MTSSPFLSLRPCPQYPLALAVLRFQRRYAVEMDLSHGRWASTLH
jgi:hypothetical protein